MLNDNGNIRTHICIYSILTSSSANRWRRQLQCIRFHPASQKTTQWRQWRGQQQQWTSIVDVEDNRQFMGPVIKVRVSN